MKNKLFFALVIALMSNCGTWAKSRLHPVHEYLINNNKRLNLPEGTVKSVLLEGTGSRVALDSLQQTIGDNIVWYSKAQGWESSLSEEKWDGIYERLVEVAHPKKMTFSKGEFIVWGVTNQGEMGDTIRGNYDDEYVLVANMQEAYPDEITTAFEVPLVSMICVNPLRAESIEALSSPSLSGINDQPAKKRGEDEYDEDSGSSANATGGTVNIYQQASAPMEQQSYSNGYQTSTGGYQTSAGSYPTTGGYSGGYASQCTGYQPSCGSGYSFGIGLAFGFLPVPTIHSYGNNCGQNYNQQPSQYVNQTTTNNYYNDYSDNSYHYTDNSYNYSYWSWYYNHIHNTTVYGDTSHTHGGPVNPTNGDGGPTATGNGSNPGNKVRGANFTPLTTNGSTGGRFANETAMASPRNKKEVSAPVVSNPRATALQVNSPQKENVTFGAVSPRSNPAAQNLPKAQGWNPRNENVTTFTPTASTNNVRPTNNRTSVTTPSRQRENVTAFNNPTPVRVAVPRGNQNGNGNTFVNPSHSDPRSSQNVNQSRQYTQTQPRNVQPIKQAPQQREVQQQRQPQYRSNPEVRQPAPSRQPAVRQQYQAPQRQYVQPNYARPVASRQPTYRSAPQSSRSVAMNSGYRH